MKKRISAKEMKMRGWKKIIEAFRHPDAKIAPVNEKNQKNINQSTNIQICMKIDEDHDLAYIFKEKIAQDYVEMAKK